MNFEKIIAEWEQDCVINPARIVDEYTGIARLQRKYMDYTIYYKLKQKEASQRVDTLKRDKLDYYRGRSEKPFAYKVPTTDVEIYLKADEELQKVESELEAFSFSVWYLEKILRMIEQRSYHVNGAADWMKYEGGR